MANGQGTRTQNFIRVLLCGKVRDGPSEELVMLTSLMLVYIIVVPGEALTHCIQLSLMLLESAPCFEET